MISNSTAIAEFAFFHTFTNIPVHKRTLRIHEVELVVDARENLSDCSGIADHAHRTHHLRQIAAGDDGRWLIIDSTFEACWAPIDELDSTLGLDGGDSRVHILRHDVSAEHEAAGHVLAMTWIALHVHRCRLEDRHCDLSHGQLLMVCLLR